MTDHRRLPPDAARKLRRAALGARAGLLAERAVRAFWPAWTILLLALAALMLGAHEVLPLEAVWAGGVAAILGLVWTLWRGARAFRWPRRAEALDRLDEGLPGRPIQALADRQAIGGDDPDSAALWAAHQRRMAQRLAAARAPEPDLKLSRRDPYALRYAALLAFMIALGFGSLWRVTTVGEIAAGAAGPAMAAGPAWEGWVEPPAHTGRPSLYLADIEDGRLRAPIGSRVTLRLYGDVGELTVAETVSGRVGAAGSAAEPQQRFEIRQDGTIEIAGEGGRSFEVELIPDTAPQIAAAGEMERSANGEMRQPYAASDDYGVTSGRAVIELDLARLDRRHGFAAEPDPRDPVVVDLPLPVTGDRREFQEVLVEDFSQHPWANLPVTITLEALDAAEQLGRSAPIETALGGKRFFDPLARAVAEQRQHLLWSRANAAGVAQILRAVSWQPEGMFRSETLYLRLRVAIRRLEAGIAVTPLSPERQEEVAAALWDIALELEHGDLADALERLQRAQDRLSEAMKNGADPAEIAELMQELREAMQDYMRQLAEQQRQEGQQNQQAQNQGEMQEMTGDQLQQMLDQIQELMEQGRMAEAQRLLDQLRQMMENMQVTQGQQGQGEGEQAMEGLRDTLRQQQGLSDEAFRDLQEQFNPNAQSGQNQQNQGRSGAEGQGQQHQGGQGRGDGQTPPDGQAEGGEQGQPGQSLADRQQALRRELERQRGQLPGAGTEAGEAAREALRRADEAMDGAEQALREDDMAEALDQQSQAMEALREGMRNLGEALAQDRQQQNGQGQAASRGDPEGQGRDPLGRESGTEGRLGTDEQLLGGEDVYRRAEELLDEIRRRSGDRERSETERDYLKRLLDRF